MTPKIPAMQRVHLIVAPDYGESLTSLPPGEPAWVADTPTNKPIIQRMWSENLVGITSFRAVPNATPEEWLLSIIDQIELHHGEHSQSPPYSALRVIGTALSERLRTELDSYGFVQFEAASDGF